MSRSLLYSVYLTHAVTFAEIRDGAGTAPQLWDYLTRTYLGREPDWGVRYSQDDLWALAVNPLIDRALRIALAFTLDFSLVTAACQYDAVQAFLKTALIFRGVPNGGWPQSVYWGDIAMAVASQEIRPPMVGIGMGCTAVRNAWEHAREPARYFSCVALADRHCLHGGLHSK